MYLKKGMLVLLLLLGFQMALDKLPHTPGHSPI